MHHAHPLLEPPHLAHPRYQMEARNVISDPVLPHVVAIIVKEHVIYLLLICYLKVFLLLDEANLVLLQVKLQIDTFFFCFGLSEAWRGLLQL